MRFKSPVLICFLSGIVAIADEPKKDQSGSIKGKWVAVSITAGGQPAPADVVNDFKCTFTDKTYVNTVGGDAMEEGEYALDDSKDPKTIDFDIKKGPDKGKKQLGIYKIEGTKLTLQVTESGSKERPKSFRPDADIPVLEFVFERSKD